MTRKESKHSSERTCVGCRQHGDPAELVRLVLGPEGEVVPDLSGKSHGRGAWIHARPDCIGRAAPRGLSASFRTQVKAGPGDLARLLRASADRRAGELIGIARRAGKLALGSAAVEDALASDAAALVVVATDARAAARSSGVEAAIAAGRAVAWGTKDKLGAALGRGDVGIAAVLDDGLAQSIKEAVAMASMPEPRPGRKTKAEVS